MNRSRKVVTLTVILSTMSFPAWANVIVDQSQIAKFSSQKSGDEKVIWTGSTIYTLK